MKKNLIALAVAATMVPAIAAAEGASISGYTDITWTHDNSTNIFWATAEVDIRNTVDSVTVGLDLDIDAVTGNLDAEQAFFAWGAAENLTIIAGKFNNPIGLEAEDSIDKPGTKSGAIYNALDAATSLHAGNNISGLAVAYNAGVATVTVGILNEIQAASGPNDDNSFALIVNASPVEGLDLELGYVTMDDSIGLMAANALDINLAYKMDAIGFTFEMLDVDGLNDQLYGLGFSYDVAEGTSVNVAYDMDDNMISGYETEIRLTAWHDLADNLTVGAGYNLADNGNSDDESVIIEFFATF